MTSEPLDPREAMEQFAVYVRPRDFPDEYVVRRAGSARAGRWVILRGVLQPLTEREPFLRGPDLEPLRRDRMPRKPGDDPVVVEVWI